MAGYRLICQLGRGGFGEVWKCEAPGGLQKAIKFVTISSDGFRQELDAFQHIKAIRHPFLLTLERVEQIGNDLVMVMELADGQLNDRLQECRAAGLPAIPREELLGYVRETAEALDMMGSKYGLQHLDVKPENIFLVAGHAKVGDYGLVRKADLTAANAAGFTPKYTPPEVLSGKVDIRSDQYSLALVYAELVTGTYPYPGRTAAQIMLQHMQGTPDLSGLPLPDQAVVARALSKDPADRFPSCLGFVRELTTPDRPGNSVLLTELVRKVDPVEREVSAQSTPLPQAVQSSRPQAGVPTVRSATSATTPGLIRPQARWPSRAEPPPSQVITDPFADLNPVMPVDRLHLPRPRALDPVGMPVMTFVETVVQAAVQQLSGVTSEPSVACEQMRFLSTMPVNMMPYKLVIVAEQWGLSARHVDFCQVILQKDDRDSTLRGGKPAVRGGYEVTVHLPTPPEVEVTASARLFGKPEDGFRRMALRDIPAILDHVRSQLNNLKERRLHPRHNFDTPLRGFPLYTDGQVGEPVDGGLIDVSLGGVRFVTPVAIGSDRVFVQFPEVEAVKGQAVYMRVLRTYPNPTGAGVVTVARFRRAQ